MSIFENAVKQSTSLFALSLSSIGFLAACSSAPVVPAGPSGLPRLGNYKHDLAAVSVEVVADDQDQLATPWDIGFNPNVPGEMWVLNKSTRSMTIVQGMDTEARSSLYKRGSGGQHFMPEPSALAFGDVMMATVHEIDVPTQSTTPGDFMGPSLWTSDPATFNAGHATHMDMMHNSPNAVGIAWETKNVFWVFDGYHKALTRYDFGLDHGPGQEDHSDGIVARFVQDEVGYVPDVASHIELDRVSNLLYVADTGNNRIAVLDIKSGERGNNIFPNYDGGQQYSMNGGVLTTLVEGAVHGMVQPSGLALHDGVVYVSDRGTSKIFAFSLTGELLDWLDVSPEVPGGSLGAIEFDSNGNLYVADIDGARILRIKPLVKPAS